MENTNMKDLLERLHQAQIKALLERIESGEATGAEFAAVNQLLKNNNITVDSDTDDSLKELEDALNSQKKKLNKKPVLELSEDDKGDVKFIKIGD